MYSKELKEQVVKLYLEQRRTYISLADEFGVNSSTIKDWVRQYKNEAEHNDAVNKTLRTMEENKRLHQRIEDLEKENDFLKKAAAFFAKESKQ